jgi:hypothetical protein
MGVSKDTARSPEDVISTPLPGETLTIFYARSREPEFSSYAVPQRYSNIQEITGHKKHTTPTP